MDGINDILSSLSEDDIENLKNAAAELFGSQSEIRENRESREPSDSGSPDLSKLLGNAQMTAKLGSLMSEMNRPDCRTRLIEALKPLLSEKRRRRADEAMQIIRLLDVMPVLIQLMGGDGK